MPGYFNIDIQALPGINLVCDCNERIPLPDNSADEILAINFVEHLRNDKRLHILNECWRLLKPNGILDILVPDCTAGIGAMIDPSHYSFWQMGTFKYVSEQAYRDLYNTVANFKVIECKQDSITGKSMGVVYVKFKGVAIK